MGFLDDIRTALRHPPGLPEVAQEVPETLVSRCRQVVFEVLAQLPAGSTLHEQHRLWGNPDLLRRRVRAAWHAVSRGLYAAATEQERETIVLEAVGSAVRRTTLVYLGLSADDLRGTLRDREITRVEHLAIGDVHGDGVWRDPVRYLIELGALDAAATRRTQLGDLLVQLPPREFVLALLHAEASQSAGSTDPYRLPRWVFAALARRQPLQDQGDEPWPSLRRLQAFGLLAADWSSMTADLEYVEDRIPWLAEAADDRSPLAILVRSALDDTAQTLTGPVGEPSRASQSSVQDLAEIVAHELGNTLAPLGLTAKQLARELGSEHRIVTRLEANLDRLQQFARSIEKILPATEPESAVAILELLTDALDQTSAERNGHLTVELVVTDLVFPGRRARLVLAFANLIRNAAQAATSAARPMKMWIRGVAAGSEVQLSFEDDGPGVAPELAARLFERGVSGRGSSGLGLAIAREVLEREHRGSIRYEPRDDGGARFVITLPAE